MLSLLKSFVVQSFRASERPDLRELADWIDNAQNVAVKAIVKLVGDSLKRDGHISDSAEKAIIAVKEECARVPPLGVPPEPPRSKTPFLDEYLSIISDIADLASLRHALLLKGFIHSESSWSLWIFDLNKGGPYTFDIREGLFDAPPSIWLPEGINVFLFDERAESDFLSLNEELGRSNNDLPKSLSLDHRDKVMEIYEDYVEIEVWKTKEVKDRVGHHTEYESYRERRDVDKDFAGIKKLIASFPIAFEKREKTLRDLHRLTKH